MKGSDPPSSNLNFLAAPAASLAISYPPIVDPVKEAPTTLISLITLSTCAKVMKRT